MKAKLVLGLTLLSTFTLANSVTFYVVGYPNNSDTFGVSINGQITRLSTTPVTLPLWSGTVADVPSSASSPEITYKYVALDSTGQVVKTEENFQRSLDKNAVQTAYDVFDREVTKTRLPDIPLVYDPWHMSKTKIFDDTVIATIHVVGDQKQFESMLQKPEGAPPMKVTFRYINDKLVHNVDNVTFGISGKSSTEFNKQAFRFDFETEHNQTFFSRPHIKLRSQTQDPTFMREKLFIDMLNVVGIPTQQGAWVRLYMNSQPVGLYLMVDDISKSFLKQTIHQGNPAIEHGTLWQMNAPLVESQGDLRYLGPTMDQNEIVQECYKLKNLGSNPPTAPMTQLVQLMKDLDDFDPLAPGGKAFWESRLDLAGVLRNLAMEYLGGDWDAYWWSGSNYFLYFNPTMGTTGGKWQWIPTDFDGTFGNGDPTDTLTDYKTYADFTKHDRPLVTKLLFKNNEIHQEFENILREIVGWAFKPEALFPRIEAYEKMLAKDVAWDYSIIRTSPGMTNSWKIADFHNSLVGPIENMGLGVKPWIEGRAQQLQASLNFVVEPGTPDRVKRAVKRPKGGSSDVLGNGTPYKPRLDSALMTFASALFVAGIVMIM
ncbi:hypothetical protein BGZ68_005512 [Mortierella alpina]|nr:hypothetical protein BGZ68_005512 [Mortierella alpina]